jgi:murein DD-endopeptidase MepM/ murein hydrolase activator NlpD
MAHKTSDGIPISDGFDFPVGPRGNNVDVFKTHKIDTVLVDPDYFDSLGFWHPGEDWNGRGGGDTDLGDPIYAISNGKVVDFGHYRVWGNIVLLEHTLPDGTQVWSQYAHLDKIMINQKGQEIQRGRQIGTMGKGDNNRYIAHLHFEIRRKKLSISNWSPLVKDRSAVLANYHDPSKFIKSHRPGMLAQSGASTPAQAVQAAQPLQIVVDTQMARPQPGAGMFAKAKTQKWFTAKGGFQGSMLWTHASTQAEDNWAEWRPSLPEASRWHVWAYIPHQNATTTFARYKIVHLDGQTEVPVNQAGHRSQWVDLGTYRFAPGQGYVRLTNSTGELAQGTPPAVGFDAMCWTKIGTTPTSEERTIRVLSENGTVQVMLLEEYLRGVVPSEMPPQWPMEALKAQAVAARGYAQYTVKHPRHAPTADICTTTHCQHHDPAKINPANSGHRCPISRPDNQHVLLSAVWWSNTQQ